MCLRCVQNKKQHPRSHSSLSARCRTFRRKLPYIQLLPSISSTRASPVRYGHFAWIFTLQTLELTSKVVWRISSRALFQIFFSWVAITKTIISGPVLIVRLNPLVIVLVDMIWTYKWFGRLWFTPITLSVGISRWSNLLFIIPKYEILTNNIKI